jgi:hypothetical protein
MKSRRLILVAFGVVVLTASALGAGVALGSRLSSGTKPKSQAYVHFLWNGTITGASKKVVAVHHFDEGSYCVEFAPSIHVTDDTFANLTVDADGGGAEPEIAMQSFRGICANPGLGFSNSLYIATADPVSGNRSDQGVYLTIP